jgi:G:T/U-mismatch repair DNA glycosylase
MDFYYPNFNNDMWRIVGLLFFESPAYFIVPEKKMFDRDKLIRFLSDKGIALYDTACAVRRLKDNASDQFLEIAQNTDIKALLEKIPLCGAIVATGQKATQTLCSQFDASVPEVGGSTAAFVGDRKIVLYRMPSSSRAFPMKLEKKASGYRRMFEELNML